MSRIKNFGTTSFGSALVGGLVVGIFGWVAIAAGWIDSSSDSQSTSAALATPPLSQPAADEGSAKGLTVNDIYKEDAPGVAFIQAQQAPQPSSPFNPFGGGGGG